METGRKESFWHTALGTPAQRVCVRPRAPAQGKHIPHAGTPAHDTE